MAMFMSFKSFNLPYGTSDAHTGKDPIITTGFIPLASDVGQSSLIYQAVKFWSDSSHHNLHTILTFRMFGFITL